MHGAMSATGDERVTMKATVHGAPTVSDSRDSNAVAPLLRVSDLRVSFKLDEGMVRAVDGVSFDVFPGQVVGIVPVSSLRRKGVTMEGGPCDWSGRRRRIAGGQML